MSGVEIWALAGAVLSGAAWAWARRAARRRGPSRGFGGVYAALFIAGVTGAFFLHGLVAGAVALATGARAWGGGTLAAHALLLGAYFRR